MDSKPCNGPLHKGALQSLSDFKEGQRTCNKCLERNQAWKKANRDKLAESQSWDNPMNRLRQNMWRIGKTGIKKEQLTTLLKPGMGWANFYIKGKRSWRFELGPGCAPVAVWWTANIKSDPTPDPK